MNAYTSDQGGRQGTVEMPIAGSLCTLTTYTFGAMFDNWHGEGRGVRVGYSPLNAVRHQPVAHTPPFIEPKRRTGLTHETWADDFILVASTKADLEHMVDDIITHAEDKSLKVQWDKFE